MKKLVFDIETDGLLDKVSTLHSLVIKDVDSCEVISCSDFLPYTTIEEGLELLNSADVLIGHNIYSYDLPALKLLYGIDLFDKQIQDTLVYSRLIYSQTLEKLDYSKYRDLPISNKGSHSLESWGVRLGVYKGDFSKTADWKFWTPEMQFYCEQDVEVTYELYKYLLKEQVNIEYSQSAVDLELKFASLIGRQIGTGVKFDLESAVKFADHLTLESNKLAEQLIEAFPPIAVRGASEDFTPKRDNSRYGYVAGCPSCKLELQNFNPNSRRHISERLILKYGWKPVELTDKGNVIVDADVLGKLHYPEAKIAAKYLELQKIVGMINGGEKAWIGLIRDGRIHGTVNTLGAGTRRCSANSPNLQQVPSHSEIGSTCRSFFTSSDDYVLIGCDASQLELRMLAHYLGRWDEGQYRDFVLSGEVHTINRRAFGLYLRDTAKTAIYGIVYGAGDEKAGQIIELDRKNVKNRIGGLLSGIDSKDQFIELKETDAKKYKYFTEPLQNFLEFKNIEIDLTENYEEIAKELKNSVDNELSEFSYEVRGKECKDNFFFAVPAFVKLLDSLNTVLRYDKRIRLIDGGFVYPTSRHLSLSYLIQGSSAVLMKRAFIIINEILSANYKSGKDYRFVLNVHDEFQCEVKDYFVAEYMELAPNSIRMAGEFYALRCPFTGEAKKGLNWKETH